MGVRHRLPGDRQDRAHEQALGGELRLAASGRGRGPRPSRRDGSGPVTPLLRQAAGRKVQLAFYGDEGIPACDWCVIREFDGAWANVELVKEKKEQRESRLIPLSSIRAITFVKGKEDV